MSKNLQGGVLMDMGPYISSIPRLFNLKRLNAIRGCAEKLSKNDLLNDKRFLKGNILDQAIVLETEYYCRLYEVLFHKSSI